jgi:CRISPR/Cas system-associated protein Cas10 (large subunit of type III CRISPR-Cas system)
MINAPSEKRCSKCGETFPATPEFFSRDRNRPGGLWHKCKACHKKDIKRGAQLTNRDTIVEGADAPNTTNAPKKLCTACGMEFPATHEFFHFDNKARDGLHGQCRSCKNKKEQDRKEQGQMRRNGANNSIPKSRTKLPLGTNTQCGSCGTNTGNILGDDRNTSEKKYGFLCFRCKKLVKDFHGDITRMYKVIRYLEKTQDNHV